MGKRLCLIAVSLLFLAVPSPGVASAKNISLTLQWQTANGKTDQKIFGTMDIAEVLGRGLYISFQKEKNQNFPGISLGGKYVLAKVPIEQMTSLELVVTLNGYGQPITKRSILFSKNRLYGSKTVTTENVYHLLVLDNFVARKNLPASLNPREIPQKQWSAAFWRTHRLAMNYA